MQPEQFVLVASEPTQAEQNLRKACELLPASFDVIGVWTGDPFFRPKGWVQTAEVNGIPFGLLKLCLDARALDYLAALQFSNTCSQEVIFVALDRLALNPRFTGPPTYDSTCGYILDGDSVYQAAAFSGIPDCMELSPSSEVNFTNAVDALILGLTPANCTVSPCGMRPLVDSLPRERSLFVPRHRRREANAASLYLPGGIEVDSAVRACALRLIRDVVAHKAEPVDPFGDGFAEFLSYLEEPDAVWRTSRGRYWEKLWTDRHDLQVNFPLPEGRDFEVYREWTENRHVTERSSPLVRGFGTLYGERYPAPRHSLRSDGFNVVGYHSRLSSQGEVARSVADLVRSMDYGVSTIDYQRTPAPSLDNDKPSDDIIQFATNIITVGGDTFSNEYFLSPNLFSTQVNVGYWFWELESVPPRILTSSELVDEVWAPSRFIYDVFSANLRCPVRYVPFPNMRPSFVPETPQSIVDIDRPLVLCVFDYFSTVARKNPAACIQAFKLAFPHETNDGPILVVKSINGSEKPALANELECEAEGRSDIRFIDEGWSRPEVLTATSKARVLVSLHRAEGLGLHIADALWLGTEVIATDYGGVHEFSGSNLLHLVQYERVQVEGGEAIYDEDAYWAEPSVEQAANLLRTVCLREKAVEEKQGSDFMTWLYEGALDHWRRALSSVAP